MAGKPKEYRVILDAAQRTHLNQLCDSEQLSEKAKKRAAALLQADEGSLGPGLTDNQVALKLGMHQMTVLGVRHRFAKLGLECAIGITNLTDSQSRRLPESTDIGQLRNREWLTVSEAAAVFDCPRRSILLLVRRKILKKTKRLRQLLFLSQAEVEQFFRLGG